MARQTRSEAWARAAEAPETLGEVLDFMASLWAVERIARSLGAGAGN
jgi:hypothetical protein